MLRYVCSLVAVAGLLSGQESTFVPPVSGLVWDQSAAALRPILGKPGAASLGATTIVGVTAAWPASSAQVVLSITADSVYGCAVGHGCKELPDAQLPDLVAWSHDDSVAVLYSFSSRMLQRIRVHNGDYAVETPVACPVSGRVTNLAVGVPDNRILLAVDGGDAGVYVTDNVSTPYLILGADDVAAITTIARREVVALRSGQIFEIRQAAAVAAFDAGELVSAARASGDRLCVLTTIHLIRCHAIGDPHRVIETTAAESATRVQSFGEYLLIDYARKTNDPLFLFDLAEQTVFFVPAGGAEAWQ